MYFYALITKMVLKIFYCPPFSLENYIYDVRKMWKMSNNSQRFSLESGKPAVVG